MNKKLLAIAALINLNILAPTKIQQRPVDHRKGQNIKAKYYLNGTEVTDPVQIKKMFKEIELPKAIKRDANCRFSPRLTTTLERALYSAFEPVETATKQKERKEAARKLVKRISPSSFK